MDKAGQQALTALVNALNQTNLSDKELKAKQKENFFARLNFQESKRILEELGIPLELLLHIPTDQADYKKLSEDSRKKRRKNFKVHKTFPAAATYRTGNRNRKLDQALKQLVAREQTGHKYNLSGNIEITAKIARAGSLLRRLVEQHLFIPELIKQARINGIDLNREENANYLIRRLQQELDLYRQPLLLFQEVFDRSLDLTFLSNDFAANFIEEAKNVCLAVKNLKTPKPNTFPTREDYRQARGGNPYPYRGGGRGGRFGDRGRGRWRGRYPYGGRPSYPRYNPGYGPGRGPGQDNRPSYGYPRQQ